MAEMRAPPRYWSSRLPGIAVRASDGLRRIEDLYRTAEELKHVRVGQQFAEISVAHSQGRNSQFNGFGLRRSIASIVKEEERFVLAAPDGWSTLAESRQSRAGRRH